MKRKQKRFDNAFDVDVEIFKLRRMKAAREKQAVVLDGQVAEWVRLANATDVGHTKQFNMEQADFIRKKSHSLRKSINTIDAVKIPKLIRTRAAVLTEAFPFVADKSVTLQP